MTPALLISMLRRVAMNSIVTCVPGRIKRTVGPAAGTAESVAGLPMSAEYCAMLQVSSAVVAGGGVAAGGAGSLCGVAGAEDAGGVVVEAVSVGDGAHAISAKPASSIREACFMAGEVDRPEPSSSKHRTRQPKC